MSEADSSKTEHLTPKQSKCMNECHESEGKNVFLIFGMSFSFLCAVQQFKTIS